MQDMHNRNSRQHTVYINIKHDSPPISNFLAIHFQIHSLTSFNKLPAADWTTSVSKLKNKTYSWLLENIFYSFLDFCKSVLSNLDLKIG